MIKKLYVQTHEGERFLKFYKGYPVSYFPIMLFEGGDGFRIMVGGKEGLFVGRDPNPQVMKDKIYNTFKHAETMIDTEIENNEKRERNEAADYEMFMEVADGYHVPAQHVPQRNPKEIVSLLDPPWNPKEIVSLVD